MALARRSLFASLAAPGLAVASTAAVLELRGAIAPPSPRLLDLAALDAIGRTDLATRTPWTQGVQHFSGLPVARLLAAVGAHGTILRAVALNDYAVTATVAELLAAEAFLATHQDGAPIPVRSRGPFWIIFPWSERPELEAAQLRQRSVWQLRRLDIA